MDITFLLLSLSLGSALLCSINIREFSPSFRTVTLWHCDSQDPEKESWLSLTVQCPPSRYLLGEQMRWAGHPPPPPSLSLSLSLSPGPSLTAWPTYVWLHLSPRYYYQESHFEFNFIFISIKSVLSSFFKLRNFGKKFLIKLISPSDEFLSKI